MSRELDRKWNNQVEPGPIWRCSWRINLFSYHTGPPKFLKRGSQHAILILHMQGTYPVLECNSVPHEVFSQVWLFQAGCSVGQHLKLTCTVPFPQWLFTCSKTIFAECFRRISHFPLTITLCGPLPLPRLQCPGHSSWVTGKDVVFFCTLGMLIRHSYFLVHLSPRVVNEALVLRELSLFWFWDVVYRLHACFTNEIFFFVVFASL